MPNPEETEAKRGLSESEQTIHDTRETLLDFGNRIKVESIINELSIFINVMDFKKKDDLVDYICEGKLGSKENQELEDIVNRIIYGLPGGIGGYARATPLSYTDNKRYTYSGPESTSPRLENKAARKLKYILDNYGKKIDQILFDISSKELELKYKEKPKPKSTSVKENPSKKKEDKGLFEGAVDRLKQGISDVYDYGVDKLSSIWDSVTSLVPSSIKNWVKENLFSPEKQGITEYINEIYQKLKGPEKPDFFPFYLAMQGYSKTKAELGNTKYLTVIDYSKPVSQQRLYVINMDTLTVENCVRTGHGKNSGNTQTTTRFSNVPNSNQTSIGFFRTPMDLSGNSVYRKTKGKQGWRGLFLEGKDERYNTNASARGIAVHSVGEFFYGSSGWNRNHTKYHHKGESTSDGCITIRTADNPTEIMDKIKGDSLIYSYYPDIKYLNESKLIR